jgi:predicted RNA-binding Zn-ribbon protein involved in translation (DUF1610 family)
MDNPIEILYKNIVKKIKILSVLIGNNTQLREKLEATDTAFKSVSCVYFNKIKNKYDVTNKIVNDYKEDLTSERVFIYINSIYNSIKSTLSKINGAQTKLISIFNNYESINIDIEMEHNTKNICDNCGGVKIIYNKNVEKYTCQNCNYIFEFIKNNKSDVVENEKSSKNMDNKSKNKFEPNKHFKEKLDQILSNSPLKITNEKEKEIDGHILKWCEKNNIRNYMLLDYASLRMCFKQSGLTKFYNAIPYFYNKYTGTIPQLLTNEEYQTVLHIFDIFKNVYYSDVKSENETNIKSYSFLAHRIINSILDEKKDPSCKIRKTYILRNIHLPDDNTIMYLDTVLYKISQSAEVKKTIFRYEPLVV